MTKRQKMLNEKEKQLVALQREAKESIDRCKWVTMISGALTMIASGFSIGVCIHRSNTVKRSAALIDASASTIAAQVESVVQAQNMVNEGYTNMATYFKAMTEQLAKPMPIPNNPWQQQQVDALVAQHNTDIAAIEELQKQLVDLQNKLNAMQQVPQITAPVPPADKK